jgi:hypothetical protein
MLVGMFIFQSRVLRCITTFHFPHFFIPGALLGPPPVATSPPLNQFSLCHGSRHNSRQYYRSRDHRMGCFESVRRSIV